MTIDPGTKNCGWSIAYIYLENGTVTHTWLGWGTVLGSGSGCAFISGIAHDIRELQERISVDVLVIENYFFSPERDAGVFSLPALIGVLKHDWFTRTGKEPIMVDAAVWKKAVCGTKTANKACVKETVTKHLGADAVETIDEEFTREALDRGENPAHCFDAIALNLFMYMTIQRIAEKQKVRREEMRLHD